MGWIMAVTSKTRKKMEKGVECDITDAQDIDRAVGQVIDSINNGKVAILSGLIDARNKVADSLVNQIVGQIFENKSVITGAMWRSVSRQPEFLDPENEDNIKEDVTIGPHIFYAEYVERRKPFLNPVFERNKDAVIKTLMDAADEVLRGE
jgi:hypothetical protein